MMTRFLLYISCIAMLLSVPISTFAREMAPLLAMPENAVLEPLASHLKINGVDMRAVQFHVGADEEKLRSYFVESCAKLGGSYTENQLHNEHIQGCITPPYSLTTQWHMEGDSAYGTLSSLRLDQKVERDPLPHDLPLPANAEILQDIETRDGDIRGRVLHVYVDAPMAKIRNTLEKRLQAQQWQTTSVARGNAAVISMSKDNRHLDIVIGKDESGKSRLVVVLDQRLERP
ncbi:MAG: hypothetical protein WCY67_01665 [Acidithiobacillus sp.]